MEKKTVKCYVFDDIVQSLSMFATNHQIDLMVDPIVLLAEGAKFTFGDTSAVLVTWGDVKFVVESLLEEHAASFVQSLPEDLTTSLILI